MIMVSYKELHEPAAIIGACFVALASILSFLLILRHLRLYTNPAEQKWIVGVLFMVPIYAIESIISLMYPKTSLACDILRNCYEAFALYAFGSYLFACLGGEERVVELLEEQSRRVLNDPLLEGAEGKPLSRSKSFRNFFIQPCVLGRKLFAIIKFGLVQYMILKTVCAFLAFLLEMLGVYGDGMFKWNYGYPYITIVLNFSQMWALYCLVQFYNVTHEKLKPIKPLAKFVSFKAIVFATWWQGVGIVLLCSLGVLPKEEKFESGMQDFLICIEMAIAAIAHVFVFSTKPYQLVPASEYEEISTHMEKKLVDIEEGKDGGSAVIEKTETEVKAPGTSITESVQDIVLEGGQQVVQDVKLTINQAIEPVEKGVTKIQESIHHITVHSKGNKESEVEIEEGIEENEAAEGEKFEESFRQVTVESDGKEQSDVEIEEHIEGAHLWR